MSKDYRHSKLQKQVHREMLKEAGAVHLPANKRHTSKKDYKRGTKRIRFINPEETED